MIKIACSYISKPSTYLKRLKCYLFQQNEPIVVPLFYNQLAGSNI